MIVEDGTGLADADALIDVAYADAYHAARGNAWAGTTTEKEQAIVKATDYMRTMAWIGSPLTDTQALPWPRFGYGIPDAIKRACAEYALRARASALEDDEAAGAAVVSETSRVGPLEKSVTYSQQLSQRSNRRSYPTADRLLTPYLVHVLDEVMV